MWETRYDILIYMILCWSAFWCLRVWAPGILHAFRWVLARTSSPRLCRHSATPLQRLLQSLTCMPTMASQPWLPFRPLDLSMCWTLYFWGISICFAHIRIWGYTEAFDKMPHPYVWNISYFGRYIWNISREIFYHLVSFWIPKEIQESRKTVCASMVWGNTGGDLLSRLSNRIYEACRAKSIQIAAFPDFGPTIAALKSEQAPSTTTTFRVCVQQQSKLKILESMATKWVNTDSLKDKAMELIELHNAKYNINGEMLFQDRRETCFSCFFIETLLCQVLWSYLQPFFKRLFILLFCSMIPKTYFIQAPQLRDQINYCTSCGKKEGHKPHTNNLLNFAHISLPSCNLRSTNPTSKLRAGHQQRMQQNLWRGPSNWTLQELWQLSRGPHCLSRTLPKLFTSLSLECCYEMLSTKSKSVCRTFCTQSTKCIESIALLSLLYFCYWIPPPVNFFIPKVSQSGITDLQEEAEHQQHMWFGEWRRGWIFSHPVLHCKESVFCRTRDVSWQKVAYLGF